MGNLKCVADCRNMYYPSYKFSYILLIYHSVPFVATGRTKTNRCHNCSTCDASYVGISGLMRHYEKFPDHNTEPVVNSHMLSPTVETKPLVATLTSPSVKLPGKKDKNGRESKGECFFKNMYIWFI